MAFLKYIALIATTFSLARSQEQANPTVTLNNGVQMPLLALGVWQYDNATAEDAVTKALKVGFTHIDTAWNYLNQQGVGKALKGRDRKSYFLTTKTPPCHSSLSPEDCYTITSQQLEYDLKALQLEYVDLVLIHGSTGSSSSPCNEAACDLDYAQWQAYEKFYADGKARAIGVSNYCVSCLKCLLSKAKVQPTVNQIQFHVGMGPDENTQDLLKFDAANKIFSQAYSPLGNGQLISDPTLKSIARKYNKSAAQVALKWITSQGLPLATKADDVDYIKEDFDLFSWNLTQSDMSELNSKNTPASKPSWSCSA